MKPKIPPTGSPVLNNPMFKIKKITPKQKRQAVTLFKSGHSIQYVAFTFEINMTEIEDIIREYMKRKKK